MTIAEKYLNDGLDSWSYYQYHIKEWRPLLLEVERSIKQNSEWIENRASLYEFLHSYYKNTGLLDEPTVTRAILRANHGLGGSAGRNVYKSQIADMLDHFQSEKLEMNFLDSWVNNIWFPYINSTDTLDEKQIRFEFLSLITGALHSLTRISHIDLSQVIEMSKLIAILELPFWIIPEGLKILTSKHEINCVFGTIVDKINAPVIEFNISLKQGFPIYEKDFFDALTEALQSEDILAVNGMKSRIVHPVEMEPWVLDLFVLAYSLSPEYMVRLVTPSKSPFMADFILSIPMFKYDLELHLLFAKLGSVWDRIEAIESLFAQLITTNHRLSYRLLVLMYTRVSLEFALQLHQPKILTWAMNKLPSLHNAGMSMIRWLGESLGIALRNQLSSSEIQQAFLDWNPYLTSNNLEIVLGAVRNKITDTPLLTSWDKVSVNMWLHLIVDTYFMRAEKLFNNRTTFLENLMIQVMSVRFSGNVSRLLKLLKIIIKKVQYIDRKWFVSEQQLTLRLNALLNSLLIGIFALANQELERISKDDVKHVLDRARRIALDTRLWDVDRDGSNLFVQPWDFKEIERAIVIIENKL